MMTKGEFHNGLRILLSIDRDQLAAIGVIGKTDLNAWSEFRRDPFRWFINCDDARAEKLWALIAARQQKAAA